MSEPTISADDDRPEDEPTSEPGGETAAGSPTVLAPIHKDAMPTEEPDDGARL